VKPTYRRSFLLATLVLGGCSGATDDLPRQTVSGQVTLNGQPLSSGTIQFQPGSGPRAVSMSGGARIQDGSYSIPRAEGLVPGKYKVSISAISNEAAAPAPKDVAPGRSPQLLPDLIPPQYNARTTLEAEVKLDDANTFNFDLKK
jgi:hypothetical protein